MTPARITHRLAGSPRVESCSDAEDHCYMCAQPVERGATVRKWMGSTFTDQPRCRAPHSDVICESCVWACSWVAPPGHPPAEDGKKGVSLRLFSHLYDAGEYAYANKASKPVIREFLRKPKRGPWFAAIANSGQKHTLPFAPLNPGPHGVVLFEDTLISLPRDAEGWAVLDGAMALLTAGATKEEIERGHYRSDTWARCADAIRAFEGAHSRLRGGGFFTLIVWLAQRDEEAVAERIEAEKAARKAKADGAKKLKTKAHGHAKDGAANADDARPPRTPRVVSRKRGKPAESLGPDRVEAASIDPDLGERRGVAHIDETRTAAGDHEQLALFGGGAPRG